MTDNLTKKQRSYTMSRIRSKWTAQETRVHNFLKSRKIKHRMHPKIAGKPDVLLKESKTAVFLHGCFWHKCSKCYKEPKSNVGYWIPKIERNTQRDRENKRALRKEGYRSVVIWEHALKNRPEKALEKLIDV